MPKLVYLDSSDFSKLSVPETEMANESREVLRLLRTRKQDGEAIFWMSAVHFSEAVHAANEHKQAAVRRAELMRELCDDNVLRFPTELPKLELRKALKGDKNARLSFDELKSTSGEWFGFPSETASLHEARKSTARAVDELLARLPRRERRKLHSELDLRKRSSHAKWRQLIQSGSGEAPIFSEFPFNQINSETTLSWLVGNLSDAEYQQRLLQVMSDPYAMFKYLLDETNNRQTLYDIIRKQGREMAGDLARGAEKMMAALSFLANSDTHFDLAKFMDDASNGADSLRHLIDTYADVNADHIGDAELSNIVRSCPAVLAFREASKAYLISAGYAHIARVRAGKHSVKRIDPSDFGDLMHSFYAPYFDVFRCDARFGAHLKKHQPVRARIADRMSDLVVMLSDGTFANARDVG